MISQQRLLAIVFNRLDKMGENPRQWASGQEAFIVQLVLLVEMSWFIETKGTWNPTELMSAICGVETNTVPNGRITAAWARAAAAMARRFVRPGAA